MVVVPTCTGSSRCMTPPDGSTINGSSEPRPSTSKVEPSTLTPESGLFGSLACDNALGSATCVYGTLRRCSRRASAMLAAIPLPSPARSVWKPSPRLATKPPATSESIEIATTSSISVKPSLPFGARLRPSVRALYNTIRYSWRKTDHSAGYRRAHVRNLSRNDGPAARIEPSARPTRPRPLKGNAVRPMSLLRVRREADPKRGGPVPSKSGASSFSGAPNPEDSKTGPGSHESRALLVRRRF